MLDDHSSAIVGAVVRCIMANDIPMYNHVRPTTLDIIIPRSARIATYIELFVLSGYAVVSKSSKHFDFLHTPVCRSYHFLASVSAIIS